MILIIAEKPSVMKNIIDAKLENANISRYKGYSIGKEFIYTHCIGHLLVLKMPGEINSNYIKWTLNSLPFNFKDIPLKVNDSVKEQYEIVNRLMHDERVTEIVNACDSDREGDLIFRNLYKASHPSVKNVSRMWIESQTPEGILESFKTRLDEREYNNVYFAGKARSYADYIIGLNSTRAMTCKFSREKNEILPIGRVQTPTLRILVDTEKEINNFVPKVFYKIQANGNVNGADLIGNYINKDLEQNRFNTKEEAMKIVEKIGLGEAIITEASTTERKEPPKLLYSLSDLQVDMDKRYHISAIDVLNTVQSLYETHKLVTYPRTDENHISKELASKLTPILKSLSVHTELRDEIINNNYKINSIMIAKKDIGAHEALTPTGLKVDKEYLKKLSLNEIHVYMAIVERFLAAFLPDARISKQKITFVKNEEVFESTFEACTFLGHRKAYTYGKKETKEETKEFIKAKENDIVNILSLDITEGKTQPPSRFSEGSLIKMMKNPSKYVDDKENKDILKKVEGIGTEATRASIIKELHERNLIEDYQKKYIRPTEKGMRLIDMIPSEDIKSVKLTAYFEKRLDEISKGTFECEAFLDEIRNLENDFINQIKGINKIQLENEQNKLCSCPICNSPIIESEKVYHCTNRSCKVAIFKNARGAKNITKTQAINLLIKGNSGTKVLCKSSKGTDFEALMLYHYVKDDQYPNHIDFDFNSNALSDAEAESLKEKPKALCKCPLCKSDIIETNFAYKCSNSQCKVLINKKTCGVKKFTKKAIIELLKDGVTSTRLDCITKNGQDISVYLTYKYDSTQEYPNKVSYLFDKKEDKGEAK
ncbi:MAG: hypothetical protein K6G28_04150 [Acholeplasmatales bacterium]|nr:hypothetical protein [Acholeplasmatales bacterium]